MFRPGQPEERLLEVVVGLGRDVVVLEVLLPVEYDRLGLDLPVLDVDLVAGQHDRDVLADPDEVPVPVGHVLVGHPAGHVEHDDGALALDVVAVPGTGNKINLVEMCNILREKKKRSQK